MATHELNITGMNCASCVAHVEKALAKVEGVEDVAVNLTTGRAKVDGRGLVAEHLVQAVASAGFGATPIDTANPDAPKPAVPAGPRASAMRRAGACLPVVAAVMFLNMAHWHGPWVWVMLGLTSVLMVVLGGPFFRGAVFGLRHRRTDMDTLIALGSGVAFVTSLVSVFRDEGEFHFGTAGAILWFITLGHALEHKARRSAASAIEGLRKLAPETASVIVGGCEIETPIEQVQEGDLVLIKPGGRIPLDGDVTQGESAIDQAMITGESEPVEVTQGDSVFAGTINQTGSLRIKVTATGGATLLGQIVEMVEQAQTAKAGVQRLADKVAGVFVPAVIGVAICTLLAWGFAMGDWPVGVRNMIAVLIVACPCALGLAVPTAILVGTGIGARRGILIKDPAALERSHGLTHIILDKTGTLTTGKPSVTQIVSCDEAVDEQQLLRLAASVEQESEHPLGKALVRDALARGITLSPVNSFKSITAVGVRGSVDGKIITVARPASLRERSVVVPEAFDRRINENTHGSRTIVGVAVDNIAVGFIGLADEIRPEAKEAIAQLRKLGLKTVMMTGDSKLAADMVARELSIDHVHAQVKPADKRSEIVRLQSSGRSVAMVGDGINDAPALAQADIGIAIGGGTDIARDAGHVVLVGSELTNLPAAIRLGRATMTRITAGLLWASIYNICLIPLAAAGIVHPMFAAGAMSLSSVSVVANALWLRWRWKG